MSLLDDLKRMAARRRAKRKTTKKRKKKRKTTKKRKKKRKTTKKTSAGSPAALRKRLAGYYKRGELGKASKLRAKMRKRGLKVK